MNTVLKVQTTSPKQISFQRNIGGSIDVVLVHPGQVVRNDASIPNKEYGAPIDQKIASLRPEDARVISEFFAQLP